MMIRAALQYTRGLVRVMVIIVLVSLVDLRGTTVSAQTSEASMLVEAVNTYRASLGLPRLSTNPALMVAAQRHVEWMARTYTYSHTGEGGSNPQSRAVAAGFNGTVGENVGGSTEGTPGEMVYFWDLSPGHRVTMRAAQATHIGTGFAANDQQRLFVLMIGTAAGQTPPTALPPIVGGTPAIAYTPPPGLIFSENGEPPHEINPYDPASVGEGSSGSSGESDSAAEAAYVMPFALIQRAEPDASGAVVHVVEVGQTAWAIAARYGVDVQALITLNHLGDPPVLRPGDRLIIQLGEGQQPPPAPTVQSLHTVQVGESLWTIAARYNHTVEELRAWNNLTAADILQVGAVVIIAPPTETPTFTPPTSTATAPPSDTPISSPSETATAARSPTQTITPIPPPTEIAQVPTLIAVDVSGQTQTAEQESGLRLLLILAVIVVLIALVWGMAIVYVMRKPR